MYVPLPVPSHAPVLALSVSALGVLLYAPCAHANVYATLEASELFCTAYGTPSEEDSTLPSMDRDDSRGCVQACLDAVQRARAADACVVDVALDLLVGNRDTCAEVFTFEDIEDFFTGSHQCWSPTSAFSEPICASFQPSLEAFIEDMCPMDDPMAASSDSPMTSTPTDTGW